MFGGASSNRQHSDIIGKLLFRQGQVFETELWGGAEPLSANSLTAIAVHREVRG